MTFSLDTHWVWDFWIADDGDRFHLFYLHAPRSLGDEHLRHRNASIGHATSLDLSNWQDHGAVIAPGAPGDFDETATWTGCVIRAGESDWRMFYTGSRFLAPDQAANVETVGCARSSDLSTWVKMPEVVLSADPRWYEVLTDGTWREEAWRDPWVFRGGDDRWHMLITARARGGDGDDRGVIGHATSDDLQTWTPTAPLSSPGAGFAHLEVPQVTTVDGHRILVFSCDGPALAGARAGRPGGIWTVPAGLDGHPFDPDRAQLLVDDRLYAGRIVHDRDGRAALMAFENTGGSHDFAGRITDPIPVRWDAAAGSVVLA